MSEEKKDQPPTEDGGVFKVDTVPPPAGEDDAYSAPTKVGPMGNAFVQTLMKEAEQRTAELSQKDAEKKAQTKVAGDVKPPPKSDPKPLPADEPPPPSKAPVSAGGTPLPRVYEEEEDEDAATVLSPKAKPPALPQRPKALQVPPDATTEAPPPPPVGPPMPPFPPNAAPSPPMSSAGTPLPPLQPPLESRPLDTPHASFDKRVLVVAGLGLSLFVIGVVMLLMTCR